MFEEPTTSTTLIRFARSEQDQPTYIAEPRRSSTVRTFTTQKKSRIEKRRQRTRTFAEDPFRARFGQRLPLGMRTEAKNMEWKTFISTYAPSTIRAESLRSTRLRGGMREYQASFSGLTGADQGTRAQIRAMGATRAVTEILADHGYSVEILELHQFKIFEATATFLYTCRGTKKAWAVGFGAHSDLSIANALCAAATNLYLR